MGFPVPERKAPYCYNGVPTASILHAAKGKERKSYQPNKVQATVGTSIFDMFKFKGAMSGILTTLTFGFGVLATVFLLMHTCNTWSHSD